MIDPGALGLGLGALLGLELTPIEGESELSRGLLKVLVSYIKSFARENSFVVLLALWSVVRAMGTTVQTGRTGLFFSFGRAKRVLQPGFVFKIPFLQQVRTLPTRSCTMDVPDQKVTSIDGLVWFVDVNLVYRIVDVRKALIEVDNLGFGMKQLLSLSVQEIVRTSSREALRLSGELDPLLEVAMKKRLEPWGVDIESAGFTSVRPSPKTLRFTQQRHASNERLRNLRNLERLGLEHGLSLAMLGSAPRLVPRSRRAVQREEHSRRRRRILQAVSRAEAEHELHAKGALRSQIRTRVLAHMH